VRHYAHQYAMWLTDEKIADGNVSSENSDVEDYFPLIHRRANGAMANAGARRRAKEETVRFCFNICFVGVFVNPALFRSHFISRDARIRALGVFAIGIGDSDRRARSFPIAAARDVSFSFFFFFLLSFFFLSALALSREAPRMMLLASSLIMRG